MQNSVGERGLVLKTSKRSYTVNYLLVGLLVLLLTMLFPLLDMQFSIPPRTLTEIFGTAVVLGFVLLICFLLNEPLFERMVRAYIITNEEFIMIEGILRKRRVSIPLNNISDITLNKGVIGRMLNYGNIVVRGMKTEIVMKGISDPDVMYRIAKNKISVKTSHHPKRSREGPQEL